MAINPIQNDRFIERLRHLLRDKHGCELELAITPEGSQDINDEFYRRAINYHQCMVPWIDEVLPLDGKTVLEIGCGSGAATVSIAEQAAVVDSFDIDLASIDLAMGNAQFFGLNNVNFSVLSHTWALPQNIKLFSQRLTRKYDLAVLPAVLEHLLLSERVPVLRALWDALRPGGALVIYDTPNRLYPFDSHSFVLPFANWLPDELMLEYMTRSPRPEYPTTISAASNQVEAMYRLGRGVSYHEFELAIGFSNMEVLADGYSRHLRHRASNTPFEGMLVDALSKYAPHVPIGFSKDYLEMVIQKKWDTIEIVGRTHVRDQLLDGTKAAMVLDQADSQLHVRLPSGSERRLCADLLRHPWSSTLVVRSASGLEIAREDLFAEYSVVKPFDLAIPDGMNELHLHIEPLEHARGHQAWVLGLGSR